MSRKLHPREPVTTAPSHVSQLNCMPILGIDPRRYLDFLRDEQVPHASVGKLRVAEVDVVRDRLRTLAASTRVDVDDEPSVTEVAHDQPETVDAVLAKIGRRLTR